MTNYNRPIVSALVFKFILGNIFQHNVGLAIISRLYKTKFKTQCYDTFAGELERRAFCLEPCLYKGLP